MSSYSCIISQGLVGVIIRFLEELSFSLIQLFLDNVLRPGCCAKVFFLKCLGCGCDAKLDVLMCGCVLFLSVDKVTSVLVR